MTVEIRLSQVSGGTSNWLGNTSIEIGDELAYRLRQVVLAHVEELARVGCHTDPRSIEISISPLSLFPEGHEEYLRISVVSEMIGSLQVTMHDLCKERG